MIDYADFEELDLRVGTVLTVNDFPQALKPAYQLQIDFGPLGKFDTSAQLTQTYTKEELEGRQVIAVLNLGSKKSQILKVNAWCWEPKQIMKLYSWPPNQSCLMGSKFFNYILSEK